MPVGHDRQVYDGGDLSPTATPNAGRITTSSGSRSLEFSPASLRILMPCARSWSLTWVMNDLACQQDAAIGKGLSGLVGVIDGAIDAIAEAEFPGEVDGQATRGYTSRRSVAADAGPCV